MKSEKSGTKTEPTSVVFDENSLNGKLMSIGGSKSDDWNNLLGNQTIQADERLPEDVTVTAKSERLAQKVVVDAARSQV